ncbi:MAG: AMP-binding protein [Burkholderiaceae bacterium]
MKPRVEYRGESIDPEVFFERYLRAAAALRGAGVGEGDVVALMMRNGPQALEVMLAARWLGALWCPINWHFKTDEVRYVLSDSGAKVFIVDADLLERLGGLDTGSVRTFVSGVDGVPADVDSRVWAAYRDAASSLASAACAPRGAMFYTSGTTGRPKGIRRAAANAEQAARGQEVLRHVLGFEPGMRALVSAPMYHSAPTSYCIGASLESAQLFIEERFDAERTLRLIEEHRITHAYLVPTMYVRMLALPESVRRRHDLSSMRFVASTGSPCAPDVKRAMIEWWGPVIHEAYGASELGYMTRLDSVEALRKPGSAGKPLPGVEIAILDDQLRPLPQGQAGLIYIHQPAFPDFSYIGNDAAREHMEHAGLKTLGDIGYLDEDGFLFIVDRAADLVISGGVNIYPAEIEAALQALPGVADCAVFGIPDAEFGEALAAAVQLDDGALLDANDVRDFLKNRLAAFKVPRIVSFHAQLPREDTGKIFKRKLREPYWAGVSRRI